MILKKAEKQVVEEVNPYSWPENYYMETRPEQRKAILEGQIRDGAETDGLRMELWEHRYEMMRKGDYKDCFLAAWLDMLMLIPQVDGRFGKKSARRQVLKALDMMCLSQTEHYGRELLLEELKHTVLLYCCTSMEDRQYSALIFGLGRMKKETVNKKLSAELYNVGTYMPQKLELTEEMALLTEAVALAKDHLGLA